MIEKISSLDGVKIMPGRRVGNTSRIADNAVQLLFSGAIVMVVDHYSGGDNIALLNSDNYLMGLIEDRLSLLYDLREGIDYQISRNFYDNKFYIKMI